MNRKRILLPNSVNSFVVEELHARLQQGYTVRIAFGGTSMLPLIDPQCDKVVLQPVTSEQALHRGDVCLFIYEGRCVVHRLIRIRGEMLTFRGDNCRQTETVGRQAVWARLVAVEHADGSEQQCASPEWRRLSRKVSRRRTLVNLPYILFSRRQRRWQRWVYFVALVLLMWAPVGGLGVPLDNFVLGIRMDHLLHASVYIPCAFFLADFPLLARPLWRSWLAALLIAVTTESVQWLLPYRGFDINDLIANFLGVTLGWACMAWRFCKSNKIKQ